MCFLYSISSFGSGSCQLEGSTFLAQSILRWKVVIGQGFYISTQLRGRPWRISWRYISLRKATLTFSWTVHANSPQSQSLPWEPRRSSMLRCYARHDPYSGTFTWRGTGNTKTNAYSHTSTSQSHRSTGGYL